MAKVWFCYEGDRTTVGDPRAELSVATCEQQFDLRTGDYIADLGQIPRFGGPGDRTFTGYRHVVIEVDADEAKKGGGAWKPGFYRVRMSPEEVSEKL